MVLPQPALPQMSVARPRGSPPSVTSSRPLMPVGAFSRRSPALVAARAGFCLANLAFVALEERGWRIDVCLLCYVGYCWTIVQFARDEKGAGPSGIKKLFRAHL